MRGTVRQGMAREGKIKDSLGRDSEKSDCERRIDARFWWGMNLILILIWFRWRLAMRFAFGTPAANLELVLDASLTYARPEPPSDRIVDLV